MKAMVLIRYLVTLGRPAVAQGRAILGVAMLFAMTASFTPAPAQEPVAPAGEPVEEASATAPDDPATVSDPLPAPNFTRAYWHVFLAFGIAWALVLGYVVLLNRRMADAERDLGRMAERDL